MVRRPRPTDHPRLVSPDQQNRHASRIKRIQRPERLPWICVLSSLMWECRDEFTWLLKGKGRWGPRSSKSPTAAAISSCSSAVSSSNHTNHSSVTSTSYAIRCIMHHGAYSRKRPRVPVWSMVTACGAISHNVLRVATSARPRVSTRLLSAILSRPPAGSAMYCAGVPRSRASRGVGATCLLSDAALRRTAPLRTPTLFSRSRGRSRRWLRPLTLFKHNTPSFVIPIFSVTRCEHTPQVGAVAPVLPARHLAEGLPLSLSVSPTLAAFTQTWGHHRAPSTLRIRTVFGFRAPAQ